MQKIDPLIRTKLHLPYIRPGLVPRPRLQEQFTRGISVPLTLITAPAGFGKTTLAVSCVADCGKFAAWLSLDKEENQVERFLAYLIAALQQTDPAIGSEAAPLLTAGQPALPEAVLTGIINDLETSGREIILVLDDFQFITGQAVHETVSFLLDHCPKTFHLVITSRSDPPLRLARLRARGQMVEIRATDLRFTEAEAAQFLNEAMGLHLDPGSIAILEERTEGWIAGLQMAALSMRDRADIQGFIEVFSGTNRYILDYLLEEVLANQPQDIQNFLLSTSILERFTAPLCDAVLTNDIASQIVDKDREIDSEPYTLHRASSILEYLDGANLFLVSLDDRRVWYRYHHLFSDLLRSRLTHSPYQQCKKVLHARASAWYATNGFPEEAIHHAMAAGDHLEAARLVETIAENVWLAGRYTSLLSWIEALPSELVNSRPWLCIWNAWAYTQIGDHGAISRWIEAAELSPGHEPQGSQVLKNEIAALKVFLTSFTKDYIQAIKIAEDYLKGPPLKHKNASHFIRCNLLHILSSMYFATGQLLKAEQTCQETIGLANELGFTLRYLHAVNKLILIYQEKGSLVSAYRILEEVQARLQEKGTSNYFAAAQLRFRKIEILYQWNRLDEAQSLVDLFHEQQWILEIPYLMVDFCNLKAYGFLIRKDYAGAQAALDEAAALARKSYIWEGLTRPTGALQVKLWLHKGEAAQAAAWAAEQAENLLDVNSISNEARALGRARILLAQNMYQEAIVILDREAESAKADGRKGRLIEIYLLRALTFQQAGELAQAGMDVESALALAVPEGYARVFLDEGYPMQKLLAVWAAHAGASPMKTFAIQLHSQFDAVPGKVPRKQESISPNNNLVEPLSRRELEVLTLMALGKTNQEIARQFIVSPGTVKAQTASIYRKLDVANRTEAVTRARQLGILP